MDITCGEIEANLSAQILEYYQKYGKNRDLRKYLRPRKSSDLVASSVSGSESETKVVDDTPTFPTTAAGTEENNDFCQGKRFENEISIEDEGGLFNDNTGNESHQSDPTKNSTSEFVKADKSSHKEPNIEVSSPYNAKKVETTADVCIQTDSKLSNGLTNSNRPLEWDSLGDVGYEKQFLHNIAGKQHLTSLERNVLRNFFSQRGIIISFADNRHQKVDSDLGLKLGDQIKQEKWRETLENMRRKYNKNASSKSSISEFVCSGLSTYAEVHSTPKCEVEVNRNSCGKNLRKEESGCENKSDLSAKSRKNDDLISSTSFEYFPENEMNKSSEKESYRIAPSMNATKNRQKHSENFDNKKDLEASFKLLSTLIRAKGLSNQEKVVLVKEVIKRLSSFEQSSELFMRESISRKQPFSLIRGKKADDCFQRTISSKSTSYSLSSTKSSKAASTSSSDKSLKMTVRSIPGGLNRTINENCCILVGESKTKSGRRSNMSANTINSNQNNEYIQQGNRDKELKINKTSSKPKQSELMQEWLEPLTASELKHLSDTGKCAAEARSDTTPKNESSYVFAQDNFLRFFEKEKTIHMNWIESEIDHLRNLQNLLEQIRKSSEQNLRSGLTILYDKVETSNMATPKANKNSEQTKGKMGETVYDVSNNKRSKKVQSYFVPLKNEANKLENVRSKLQTPSSELEESIRSYVQHRKQKFLDNYRKAHYKSFNNEMESGHYSEPREQNAAQNSSDSRSSTVVTKPNVLVSSDSMSIVCTTNCSTTSSIKHYETAAEKATQTNDSLGKSMPILGGNSSCNNCKNPFLCTCFKQTIRTYPDRINKAAQAKPQAEAYIITFCTPKNTHKAGSSETRIQELLQKNYPKFVECANERREALKTMRNRRQQRRILKDNIIQNHSINSIENKLSKLKPTFNDDIRIFAPDEIKTLTTRRYLKLNEVVEKVEKEKAEKAKRCNKMLVEIFNKKVQRQVRKGKSSFPLL